MVWGEEQSGSTPVVEDTKRRGYHRLGDPPWGAKCSSHKLDIPALGTNSGKMSSLGWFESQWDLLESCKKPRLSYRRAGTGLLTPGQSTEAADWKLPRPLASPPGLLQHTLQPSLGSCSRSSCSGSAIHEGRGYHCQWDCTHMEGMELSWTQALLLTRAEAASTSLGASLHTLQKGWNQLQTGYCHCLSSPPCAHLGEGRVSPVVWHQPLGSWSIF